MTNTFNKFSNTEIETDTPIRIQQNFDGTPSADIINGTTGDNVIRGFAGDDTLRGLAGDDVIEGGEGADDLNGNGGQDTLSYETSSAGVTVELNTGLASGGDAEGDTFAGFEHILGSAFDDTLKGDGNSNTFDGGAGDDTINTGAGDDLILGNIGFDTLNGGAGAGDILSYENLDGRLSFIGFFGGTQVEKRLNGPPPENEDDPDPNQQFDQIAGFETIRGTAFNDFLGGGGTGITLEGGLGDDIFRSAITYGNDIYLGQEGNDMLQVEISNGQQISGSFDGGSDTDLLDGFVSGDDLEINMGAGTLTNGNGVITFTNVENIDGGGGDDTLFGDGNANTIGGGFGNDAIFGRGGADTLNGEAGNDTIEGGGGADTMDGGTEQVGGDAVTTDDGTENDTLSYASSAAAVNVDLGTGTASGGDAAGDTFTNFESLLGSAFDDTLTGDANDNTIDGGLGADTMDGGDGFDTLSFASNSSFVDVDIAAGSNSDGDTFVNFERYVGTAFNDVFVVAGAGEIIEGGDGDDLFEVTFLASDLISGELKGGAGTDQITAEFSEAISIHLGDGVLTLGNGSMAISGFENITGSSFDDFIRGDAGNNEIHGGDGNDELRGNLGDDIIYAGRGDDFVEGSNDQDLIFGGEGDDELRGGINDDEIHGEDGNDQIFGGSGDDTIDGGEDDDLIDGGSGADTMDGGNGVDTLDYSSSNGAVTLDIVAGTGLRNAAEGDTFSNFENFIGSGSDDVFIFNLPTGTALTGNFNAAGGDDTADFSGAEAAVEVNNTVGQVTFEGSTFTTQSFQTFIGSGFDDTFTSNGSKTINAGDGNDTITGSGRDRIFGEDGDDVITIAGVQGNYRIDGGAGNDHITGHSGQTGDQTTILGGDGDDIIVGSSGRDFIEGGAGADTMDGLNANGFDTLSYQSSDAGVNVSLLTGLGFGGHAEGDVFTDFEAINGSAFDDTLIGDARGNVIQGRAGADTMDGGEGDDTLNYRNSGSAVQINLAEGTASGGHAEGDIFTNFERIDGSDFNDTLFGDDGENRLNGIKGQNFIEGGGGADQLTGGDSGSTLGYTTSDAGVTINLLDRTASGGHAEGDTFDDKFSNVAGSAHDDSLTGKDNANLLEGRAGDDTLLGLGGNDDLRGANGADTLNGGAGADRYSGGNGADTFVINEGEADGDFIADFEANDRIISNYADFIKGAGFSGSAGELRYFHDDGFTIFEGDIDGDGVADESFTVNGEFGFEETEFGILVADTARDFDTNGFADLMFQTAGGGNFLRLTDIDGLATNEGRVGHTPVGFSDLDGDGLDDLVLKAPSGAHIVQFAADNANSDNIGRGQHTVLGFVDIDGDGVDEAIAIRDNPNNARVGILDDNFQTLVNQPITDQTLAGFGDFNGDGIDDALLESANGGKRILSSTDLVLVNQSRFITSAIADFTGDGIDDVLGLHEITDDFSLLLGDAVNPLANTQLLGLEGHEAVAVLKADFGSTADLLMHDTLTDDFVLLTDGLTTSTQLNVAGDTFEAIGDFNGDGIDDVLLRMSNDNGRILFSADRSTATVIPEIDGKTVSDIGDFDGDGADDILLKDDATGAFSVYSGLTGEITELDASLDDADVVDPNGLDTLGVLNDFA
ncbi:MAG: hypothetical protein CMK07_03945 [Ponticaulis sp.]|nr:hypothetical protein [Ponticaulis sp.]